MQWGIGVVKNKFTLLCDVSVTLRDALITLHDSRPEDVQRGLLGGGVEVTLGVVGGRNDVMGLLRSCREWKGPKVRSSFKGSGERMSENRVADGKDDTATLPSMATRRYGTEMPRYRRTVQ